jgi:hypothetical protein
MYGYEFAALARMLDFRLNVVSVAAGNELPGEPETLWPRVLEFLDRGRPDAIVIAQAWWSKLEKNGEEHFRNAMSKLIMRTNHIFVLTQPPVPPSAATRQSMRSGARPPFFEDPVATEGRSRANAILRKFVNERVHLIDVAPLFMDAGNSIRVIAPNGRTVFQDEGHLSDAGTSLVRPVLEKMLQDVCIAGCF